MTWSTLTPVFIIFIGFYSIRLSSDYHGRRSRIAFKVLLDVRSFVTTQEDGLSTGQRRCPVASIHHLASPPENQDRFFPSVLRHANRGEASHLPPSRRLFSHHASSPFSLFSFNIRTFASPQAARHCRYTRYFLFSMHLSVWQILRRHATAGDEQVLLWLQAEAVLTLKLGSFRDPPGPHGQVLSLDWLPVKPHNTMAVGFYDGENW